MFLKANNRDKDGKTHFYWSLMKNVRDQLDLTLSTQPAPKGFSSSVCTSQMAMHESSLAMAACSIAVFLAGFAFLGGNTCGLSGKLRYPILETVENRVGYEKSGNPAPDERGLVQHLSRAFCEATQNSFPRCILQPVPTDLERNGRPVGWPRCRWAVCLTSSRRGVRNRPGGGGRRGRAAGLLCLRGCSRS